MRCLFVGGRCDGEWHEVNVLMDKIFMPVSSELDLNVRDPSNELEVKVEEYEKMVFITIPRREFVVYALYGLDFDQVFSFLLNGYEGGR